MAASSSRAPTPRWSPQAGSMRDWHGCSSRGFEAETSELCRPCARRDPYAVPLRFVRVLNVCPGSSMPGVMGPCVRRDDNQLHPNLLPLRQLQLDTAVALVG